MKMVINTLSISPKAIDYIRQHFIKAFAEAEDMLLTIMEREIVQTIHGGGPGKPEWRADLRDQLRVVEEKFVDTYLEASVGQDTDMILTDFIKAMIVAEGAGSAGTTGHCIAAGPAGRMVWDDDLSGQHPSRVQTPYMQPPEFNQLGNHFIENSMQQMKKHFTSIMENALSTLSDDALSKQVLVSRS